MVKGHIDILIISSLSAKIMLAASSTYEVAIAIASSTYKLSIDKHAVIRVCILQTAVQCHSHVVRDANPEGSINTPSNCCDQ